AGVDATGAAAVDYLRLFALVSMGWMWTRMAAAAAGGDTPLHGAKLAVADFFARRMLPQAQALAAGIAEGEGPVMALAADAF
ncbi:acyl-CoA dehydrogenase C-terminal domain-containing protein, partial [Sphingobium jiangsuense]